LLAVRGALAVLLAVLAAGRGLLAVLAAVAVLLAVRAAGRVLLVVRAADRVWLAVLTGSRPAVLPALVVALRLPAALRPSDDCAIPSPSLFVAALARRSPPSCRPRPTPSSAAGDHAEASYRTLV